MLQLIFSHHVFLQDKGMKLGIDNRRLFHIISFFMYYFNVILGIISCISRLLRGLAVGLVFLGRLDHPIIQRNFEMLDPGYRAYLGFLRVEEAHCNPTVVAFCQLLVDNMQRKEHIRGQSTHVLSISRHAGILTKRCRNRWLVGYTLIHNPSLALSRTFQRQKQSDNAFNPVRFNNYIC
ncbi:stimulated by retinoic acid gene 6 protein-like [Saccoglossus kowalevskii]